MRELHVKNIPQDLLEHMRELYKDRWVVYDLCDELNYHTKYKGEYIRVTGTMKDFKQLIDDND